MAVRWLDIGSDCAPGTCVVSRDGDSQTFKLRGGEANTTARQLTSTAVHLKYRLTRASLLLGLHGMKRFACAPDLLSLLAEGWSQTAAQQGRGALGLLAGNHLLLAVR
jgi:hypothetical protein